MNTPQKQTETTVFLTPARIAKMLHVTSQTVLSWIASGELPATDVSRKKNPRRRSYRVATDDLIEFRRTREVKPSEVVATDTVKDDPFKDYVLKFNWDLACLELVPCKTTAKVEGGSDE